MPILRAVYDYSRLKDYWLAAPLTMLAGSLFSGGFAFSPLFIALMLFTLLSFAFGFSINDYFDAELDKAAKKHRNPLSSGRMTKRQAAAVTSAFLAGSLTLLLIFPSAVALLGLAAIALFFFYSCILRSKARPVLDVVHHAFLFPPYALMGFMMFAPFQVKTIFLFTAIFLVSLIVQFIQEIHDYETDRKSIKTTVTLLGRKNSIIFVIAGLAGITATGYAAIYRGFLPQSMYLAPPLMLALIYPLVQAVRDEKHTQRSIDHFNRNSIFVMLSVLIIYAAL